MKLVGVNGVTGEIESSGTIDEYLETNRDSEEVREALSRLILGAPEVRVGGGACGPFTILRPARDGERGPYER